MSMQDSQNPAPKANGIQALQALGAPPPPTPAASYYGAAPTAGGGAPYALPGVAPGGELPHVEGDHGKIGGILPKAGAVDTEEGYGYGTTAQGYPSGYNPNNGPGIGNYTNYNSTGYAPGSVANGTQQGTARSGGDQGTGGQQAANTAGGNGVAGGQQVFQPGNFGMPDLAGGFWSEGGAFNDPNASNIYGVINNQIDSRANQAAPVAGNTNIGAISGYNGAGVGQVAGASAAQISPQMMANAATLNTGSDTQYQAAQNAQINALNAQAQGQGPSVAETTAKQLAESNIAAQMGALGSQRGGSAALGIRAAQQQAATANQAAASQGALGRSQEAMSAQSQLAGALSGARGQSQATATTQAQMQQQALLANQGQFNAASQQQAQLQQNAAQYNATQSNAATQAQAGFGQQAGLANQGAYNAANLQQGSMDQQTNLANQQAQLQQSQLNNAQYQAGLAAYMQQNQGDIQNSANYQQMLEQEQLQKYGIDNQVGVAQTGMAMQGVGAGVGALGALFSLSDRRGKKNIKSGESELGSFLDRIRGESPLPLVAAPLPAAPKAAKAAKRRLEVGAADVSRSFLDRIRDAG